jgi:hypothetical protein
MQDAPIGQGGRHLALGDPRMQDAPIGQGGRHLALGDPRMQDAPIGQGALNGQNGSMHDTSPRIAMHDPEAQNPMRKDCLVF